MDVAISASSRWRAIRADRGGCVGRGVDGEGCSGAGEGCGGGVLGARAGADVGREAGEDIPGRAVAVVALVGATNKLVVV